MMALADKNGEVSGTVPGLARVASLNIADVEAGLERFTSPDPYSRTRDDDGKRIEEIEGGWVLLNHAKYRDMASKEDQKRKNAERQKRFRDKQKRNGNSNGSVTVDNDSVTQSRDIAEAEAEAEADFLDRESKKGEVSLVSRTKQVEIGLTDFDPLFEVFKKIGSESGIPEEFCRITAIKAVEAGTAVVSPGAYLGAAWLDRGPSITREGDDSGNSKDASESKSGAKREVWQIEKDIERFKAERLAIQKDPAKRIAATGQIETKEEHRERLEAEWMDYLRSAAAEFEETLQPDWIKYEKALEEDRGNLQSTGLGSPELVDDEGYRLERLAGMFPKDVAEFERWAKDFKKEPWIDPGALTSEAKAELQILKDALQRMEIERKEAMLKENA